MRPTRHLLRNEIAVEGRRAIGVPTATVVRLSNARRLLGHYDAVSRKMYLCLAKNAPELSAKLHHA